MEIKYKKIAGKENGPKIAILGGVHGNELAGVILLQELFRNPPVLLSGELHLVLCNPKAVKNGQRFIDEDLNRCFLANKNKTKSYEEILCEEIKQVLDLCDIAIDFHCSNSVKSIPFVIRERNSDFISKYLIPEKEILGFTKNEPGGTDAYMNENGKIGICIECGYSNNPNTVIDARNNFWNILASQGMIDKQFSEYKEKITYQIVDRFVPKLEFIQKKNMADFTAVKKGEILGFENKEPVLAAETGEIIFLKNVGKTSRSTKRAFILIQELQK
jgi:succinylglutamate desuccinylase